MTREFRFYLQETHFCAHCGCALRWAKRADPERSMMLVHDPFDCPLSGKKFYAPGRNLTEMPEDAEEDRSNAR